MKNLLAKNDFKVVVFRIYLGIHNVKSDKAYLKHTSLNCCFLFSEYRGSQTRFHVILYVRLFLKKTLKTCLSYEELAYIEIK